MKSQLLIYFGTNIIVTVSCDASGRSHGTEPIFYSGQIDDSHIERIKKFYEESVGISKIDTHYVFAETLDTSFKKEVIKKLSLEGMTPKSFTLNPSVILTEYALKQNSINDASFGEHVMVIYSNDESLRLTGAVFDGKNWQWNASKLQIDRVGSSPLKRCIVECLINERDKNLHAIDERNREKEVEYQMQFVEDWLSNYKKLESSDNFVVDFKFSFESSTTRIRIPKKEVELSYDKLLSPAITSIIDYKKDKCDGSLKYAILVGFAFEEENFTSKVKNALECNEQFSVVTINRLTTIFKEYLEACDFEEDYGKYDKITQEKELIYKNNLEWIQYAQELTKFNDELLAELKVLQQRVSADTETFNSMMASADRFMRKSEFEPARDALKTSIFPSTLAMNSIKESRALLAKKENLEGVFDKLNNVDGARFLIHKIQENAERITDQINTVNKYSEDIKKRLERIDFCESHFDEYLDLKRVFKRTSDYKEMKSLVEKMKELSDEPMPELTLRQVSAQISATKEKVKDGWFKKKSILRIHVSVKGEESLPCDALLNVSNKMRVRPSEGDADCLAFEIRKGQSSFTVQVDSTKCQLDFNTDLVCQLFTAVDVIDKKAIDCEPIIIK